MSKSVESTRRELFESLFPDEKVSWNGSGYYPLPNAGLGDGVLGYCLTREKYLEVFNAALDAVEIELPEKEYSCEYGFHYYDAGNTIEAIESLNLGLKIK